MKNLKYCLIVFLSLFIFQCSNEIPTSNEPVDLDLGKILLRIDKANAPAEVVLVEAFLTRANYDTIYGSLDLLSSASADITIEDVAAGEWHLKVDAKDSSGVVLYTGETYVNILAGILTQVNLTLVPTGLGTGSIYIYVTWGQGQIQGWVDYPGNPVLTKQNTFYDNFGVSHSVVLKEDNLYRMWYVGDAGSAHHFIMYAESQDGINWVRPQTGPIISPGSFGSWDSWSVHTGAIIKENGGYKMYYSGFADKNDPWHIGLATSPDGISWTKHSNPVLFGGTSNEFQLSTSAIIKIDNVYHLYYSAGHLGQTNNLNLATSTDGINWTKYSGNPILTTTYQWEGSGIHSPTIIKENNIYKMAYQGQNNSGFGMATSTDGINWTASQLNPFFTTENTINLWGETDIAYPNFVKISENETRIYYTGCDDNSDVFSIGFMKRIP